MEHWNLVSSEPAMACRGSMLAMLCGMVHNLNTSHAQDLMTFLEPESPKGITHVTYIHPLGMRVGAELVGTSARFGQR
jgi:hypothetical protein